MVLHKKSDFGFNGYRVPELPQGSRSIRKKRSDLRRNPDVDRLGAMDVLATVAGMLLGEKVKAPTLNSGDQKVYTLKDIVETKPMKVDPCCRASCDAHGQTSSGSIVSHASDAARNGSDEAMVVDRGTAAINLRGPVEDGMDLDHKPPALASSDSSVDALSCRDQILNSMKRGQHGGDGEDDSSGCTHPGPIVQEPLGKQNRRIRKVCSSKFWKVGPTLLDGEFFSGDVDVKPPIFRSRKTCSKRQRTQRSQFKRRKLHDRSVDCIKVEGEGVSSFLTKPKMSVETEDYKVKLRIESFKIPEVFIEMPENATVGSLKRTVLETVTAMLGNDLRVGLILQGRKVRDDTRTLLQAGITRGEKHDTLGFTLEPTPSPAPLQLAPENPPPLLTCESPEPLARLPALPTSETGVDSGTANPEAHKQPRAYGIDGDQELPNPTPNSKALVPVTTASGESALSLVSQSGKPRRPEAARRIRRPFSVTEVEALVQAVEKLGTGRWRDVKLRAFDDAKHRTYVDLKDKWKTLVHTARISPQQRRGEPVPQELLDRVLAAHAYWSQHQAKLQVKPMQSQLKTEQCALHL